MKEISEFITTTLTSRLLTVVELNNALQQPLQFVIEEASFNSLVSQAAILHSIERGHNPHNVINEVPVKRLPNSSGRADFSWQFDNLYSFWELKGFVYDYPNIEAGLRQIKKALLQAQTQVESIGLDSSAPWYLVQVGDTHIDAKFYKVAMAPYLFTTPRSEPDIPTESAIEQAITSCSLATGLDSVQTHTILCPAGTVAAYNYSQDAQTYKNWVNVHAIVLFYSIQAEEN